MQTIDEFLEKLDSGGTYMMWSLPLGDTGEKVFKEEIIKDPYRVKAAKIIRILITQDQHTQDLSFPSKFEKINKILNEDL